MHSLTLVDAADLESWAVRRDSQGRFPQVLRRLIHGTVDRVLRIDFPSGESVQLGGWDGTVVVDQGNAYVPGGSSVWELSAEATIKQKADEDYSKRLADPRGVDPTQSAFVFATPRRFAGKEAWLTARRSEGRWREVYVWDSSDLEQWLELAPAVHVWLSNLLGKRPDDAKDLGNHWEDWSAVTRPATSPEFVLAGRGEVIEAVTRWLRKPSDPLALRAQTRDEALAAFMAVLHQLPSDERVVYLSRAVIARSHQAWDRLAAATDPLILVPDFEVRGAVETVARATRAGHHVVIPLGQADSVSMATVSVPRISTEAAAKVLADSGVAEGRAQHLAALARKSFTSFRRKLAHVREIHQPAWSRPTEARVIVPAMLVGAWDEAHEADRQAVAALSQVPYGEFIGTLVRWSQESDAPVRHVGDAWFIVSKEDAWDLLRQYITPDDLDRLQRIAIDILCGPDPRYDMPAAKRWMAKVLGSNPPYSRLVHKGLADTLAMMGTRGESTPVGAGASVSDYATRIVRNLFERANTDWRIWASLSPVLPLIAEAAPDVFLSEVEAGLAGDQPLLLSLFTDQESDTLFADSPHTGLLWALETVAWDPERLGRVALLLARLARLDPGGRLANRPKSSLHGIFLLWHPQTSATLSQRLVLLDTLRDREPDVAWRLMRELIPDHSEVGFPTRAPEWREWAPDPRRRVPRAELATGIREVASRAIADAGVSGSHWRDLIEALPSLPEYHFTAAVDRLAAMDVDRLPTVDGAAIWNALRKLVSQHRSFSDADWALPKERVDILEVILHRFEPADLSARFGWLFGNAPTLPQGRTRDWKTDQDALKEARLNAVRTVHAQAGLAGVLGLIPQVEQRGELGFTVGISELAPAEEDGVLREHLVADDSGRLQFARGLIAGRMHSRGQEWVEQKLSAPGIAWSPIQRAELMAFLPKTRETWDLVEEQGLEVAEHYWRLIDLYRIADEDRERGAIELLKHGRPYSATELLALCASGAGYSGTDFVVGALEQVLQALPGREHVAQSFSHDLGELLDFLEKSDATDQQRIASLEWAFLPILSFERAPTLLHRRLSTDPSFFAEVLSLVFRGEGEEPRELTPEEQARAERGYELLDSWGTVPGTGESGRIDSDALMAWVKRAREAAAAAGRLVMCDQMIGKVLSASPAGADGFFPDPAVRNVIDRIASVDLDRGFEIGVYNNRGTVRKSPMEGGVQERQLMTRYEESAKAIAAGWSRTATLLRRLAEGYRREALGEDQTAQLREDLNTW